MHWLVTLARCFEEQARATSTLEHATRKLHNGEELVLEYEEDLVGLRRTESELARQVRSREGKVQELEAKIERKRQQLDQIRDNKAYKALSEEIAAIQSQVDEGETEILQILERLESLQQQIYTLAEEITTKRSEIAARTTELELAAQTAQIRQADLAREVSTCLSQLPAELVTHIQRLQQKLPLPIAWLDDEACGGCHAHFPTQVAIEITRGQSVVRCQTCGRFVVSRP